MGSCVSVQKDPTSVMRLRFSVGSGKNDKVLIPSPVKEKASTNGDVAVMPKTQTPFRSFGGSKEEIFFDSQPWLESDCEDDFHSVNGDFTPSRGNTPVHHNFSSAPQRNVIVPEKAPALLPEPSPKKRLSELFKESLRKPLDTDNHDGAAGNEYDKSSTGTPYVSGANSVYSAERTSNGGSTPDETSVRSAQCCLPRMRSSLSFNERKKKLSPTHSVG